MRYWDASALLPLVLREPTSDVMDAHLRDDPAVVTWWGTRIECMSAIARLERDGALRGEEVRMAITRLDAVQRRWSEVPAIDDVRVQAVRLLRSHRLRAADALQLAAAVVASDFTPAVLPFITRDHRLADAAEREGFRILGG